LVLVYVSTFFKSLFHFEFQDDASDVKEDDEDNSNFIAEFFRSAANGQQVPENFVNQVLEDVDHHQLGTHFLTAQNVQVLNEENCFPTKKRRSNENISFSATKNASTKTTWVQCDKCQRTIKLDEFSDHYRDVHVETTSTSNNSQVKAQQNSI